MAYTTYIFREDLERLKREAARGPVGGSLYGQLTSTGNPVVHVAFSESGPQRTPVETLLYDNYKLCHIGEWIAGKQSSSRRQDLVKKYKGRGRPSRFVILEVDNIRQEVTPFHFVEQSPAVGGRVEELKGENPFNRQDVLKQAVADHQQRTSAERHHTTAGAVAIRAHQSSGEWQRSPAPRGHVAKTSADQWYASQEGQAKLRFVLDSVRAIAQNGEVDMARDTETHDMCMSFTDRLLKKWEVKFSASFPKGGVLVTNKSQSRTTQTYPYYTSSSSYGNYGLQPHKMLGCERVEDMVERIKNYIRSQSF